MQKDTEALIGASKEVGLKASTQKIKSRVLVTVEAGLDWRIDLLDIPKS
jgi:hypothetical protein